QVPDAKGDTVKPQRGERGLYLGNLVRPKGVAVDSEGNIYVVESLHDYLLVYNREGQLLLALGGTGGDIGQFYLPSGVWVDSRDRIFVADMFNARVMIFQFLGGKNDGK
ncbi:MAG: SBBP repeat-containing protein, partial [Candidatus Cloacimonetes bacterium]|nr:SBBP repeat-containing protein [Candidatus Cloacimonadota bacterium]